MAVAVVTGTALHFAPATCPRVNTAARPDLLVSTTAAHTGQARAATTAASPAPAASATAVPYDPGDAEGSCSLGPFPAGGLYISLPPEQYAGGRACGSYLDVTGPHGEVRAEVVDLCPTCEPTTIDLASRAFAQVADPETEWAPVTYRQSADPLLPGPLELRVASTVDGRLTLQVLNHGNRLTAVATAPAAGTVASGASQGWQPLTLAPDDYWVSPQPPGSGQETVRVTDDRGHQAVISRVQLIPGTTIRSHVWMYRPVTQSPQPVSTSPSGTKTTVPSATHQQPPPSTPGC